MKLSFCIINRCIYVEYGLQQQNKRKKLTSPFPSLLNYALSLIVIAVHRFRQVFESAHLLLSSMPLPLSLHPSLCPLSHDVNYRFWMSSSSNYSGADLLFFLSFPLYIYIDIICICMCAPARQQTWKYPCLLST